MRRPALTLGQVADRTSAYVYGNILVLASLVVLRRDEVVDGVALAIVAGTAVSTFVAHAFAEQLAEVIREADDASIGHVVRDSLPILSAAAVPTLLMLAGALDVVGPTACLRAAEAWVVVRLGLTAFVVERLHSRPVTLRTWVASLALAATGVAVVAVKVVLTH